MKVSYLWLKELVNIKTGPEKLGEELSMAGLSVASLERAGDDWIYDIEVTSNRPDWLSMRGIAAEVAAITGGKFKKQVTGSCPGGHRPDHALAGTSRVTRKKGKGQLSIHIDAAKDCGLYCAALIKNVKVGPSPAWLSKRLEAVGLRPVNNVVDITNYCLMELGQPLHAFDFDKIAGGAIVVRRAKETERLTLIDGSQKQLSGQVLVIADMEKPIAVAGIMGGQGTEVHAATVNVLLESACFDPVRVRRGTRVLGVTSDSSYRFERGVDVSTVRIALDHATWMICEICSGTLVTSKQAGLNRKAKPRKIRCSVSRICDVLSIDISAQKTKSILEKLGFNVRRKSSDIFEVSVPSYRRDVKILEDITEEIARIYGYDRIPLTRPAIKPFSLDVPIRQVLEPRLKNLLTAAGLKEVITYSLVSDEDYRKSSLRLAGNSLSLENPLSQDTRILRTTLVPSLLGCIAFNINRNNRDLEIFEISRVFIEGNEPVSLGIALCGARRETWLKESRPYAFFDLKGILEAVLEEFQVKDCQIVETEEGFAEKGTACQILAAGQTVASFGKVSQEVKRAWGIKAKEDVFIAEVSVDALAGVARLKKAFKEIASTPSIFRDISMLAPANISYAKIKASIERQAQGYVRGIALADYYQGREITAGHTGLTISVEYGLFQKTLTDEEVKDVHQRVLQSLVNEYRLKLR